MKAFDWTVLLLLHLLSLWGDVAQAAASSEAASTTLKHAENMIAWIRKEGGFVNTDKVAFRPIFPDDPEHSPNGLFAIQDIKEGERLFVIPNKCLLGPQDDDSDDMCETANRLLKERKLGKQSHFSPYVEYLFDGNHQIAGQLPTAWSKPAQEILATILGRELPPSPFGFSTFRDTCDYVDIPKGFTPQDEENAWHFVIARSWNEVMIPLYDMVNHRNGDFHNIDQATSAHTDEDVVVVALRDITKDEQLYISYNECHDTDCDDIRLSYVTPEILKDYGFVEQYPRRWNLLGSGHVVFELHQDEDDGSLQLEWLSRQRNDFEELSWFRGQLKRLKDLEDYVMEGVEDLPATNERETIVEYYEALKTALDEVIWASRDTVEPSRDRKMGSNKEVECETSAADGTTTCHEFPAHYENLLVDKPDTLHYNSWVCNSHSDDDASYQTVDVVQSQYQSIRFDQHPYKRDTCLYLSDWLQTCTSWRPHYHEAFVHYPSRYIDQVQRVLFLGGGDNMLVHEILKYPTLELVIGMELDQQVVRSTFKHIGTQPHFDNDKVQWWFGDATKSLLMLPKSYYGTFDLVLVDLQTFVADTLMVTKDLNIMDVVQLLLKPDGIIARNEDFVARRKVDFAEYTVDLEYHDLPQLCQQSITIGSNAVDFLKAKAKDHNLDNVYFNASGPQFDGWYNYRKNIGRVDSHCKETTNGSVSGVYGVLIVLEAEGAAVPAEPQARISDALKKAALSEISTVLSSTGAEDQKVETIVYILREGYVVARSWAQHNYFAFDVLLWSGFDKQEAVKNEIITAVGAKSSSSYRIVVGGMQGVDHTGESVGPDTSKECKSEVDHHEHSKAVAASDIDTIHRKLVSLMQVSLPVIAVVCADKATPCSSLEALKTETKDENIIPIYICPDLSKSFANGDTVLQSRMMTTCEDEIQSRLYEATERVGKISGIVFDTEAPHVIGQIVHHILRDAYTRRDLLMEHFVVLASETTRSVEEGRSWRVGLLERFRTDFVQFSPAYRTEILFNSTSSSLELGIFSAEDTDFYSHLAGVVSSIEEETGLVAEVRLVKDGVNNFISDFTSSKVVSDDDYDYKSALEQWKSQRPVGQQTWFQFEKRAPKAPLVPRERVLINYRPNVWTGRWYHGRVVEVRAEEGLYRVEYEGGEEDVVGRDLIRKLDTPDEQEKSPIDHGERVLITEDDEDWSQGSIIERKDDGTYRVQVYDGSGHVVVTERKNLIRQAEPTLDEPLPLSVDKVKKTLYSTMVALGKESKHDIGIKTEDELKVNSDVGDGCVIVAMLSQGSIVLTWDGSTHIDVNLFTFAEDDKLRDDFQSIFLGEIPSLAAVSRDNQPRGFNSVVNFPSEMEWKSKRAHWMSEA